METLRPAKKLPQSPKKQIKEDTIKVARPAQIAVPPKGVKHPLEIQDSQPRTANYGGAGTAVGQSQHSQQDTKRRRTDDVEDKEIITSKPMRVSVIKQVFSFSVSLISGREAYKIDWRGYSATVYS